MDSKRQSISPLHIKNPVLIIGGFASVEEDFEPLISELRSWCSPISILLPDGDMEIVIEKITCFLDSLGLKKIPVIGYSMGGRVALEIYRNKPDYFHQLICLSTRVLTDSFCIKKRAAFEKDVLLKITESDPESFFNWWYSLPLFAGYTPPKKSLEAKIRFGATKLLEQFKRLSILKQAPFDPQFTQPVHFIYGQKDPLEKEMGDCFKDTPQPIFQHTLPACGHLVHLEQPFQLAKLLKRILT